MVKSTVLEGGKTTLCPGGNKGAKRFSKTLLQGFEVRGDFFVGQKGKGYVAAFITRGKTQMAAVEEDLPKGGA